MRHLKIPIVGFGVRFWLLLAKILPDQCPARCHITTLLDALMWMVHTADALPCWETWMTCIATYDCWLLQTLSCPVRACGSQLCPILWRSSRRDAEKLCLPEIIFQIDQTVLQPLIKTKHALIFSNENDAFHLLVQQVGLECDHKTASSVRHMLMPGGNRWGLAVYLQPENKNPLHLTTWERGPHFFHVSGSRPRQWQRPTAQHLFASW